MIPWTQVDLPLELSARKTTSPWSNSSSAPKGPLGVATDRRSARRLRVTSSPPREDAIDTRLANTAWDPGEELLLPCQQCRFGHDPCMVLTPSLRQAQS